MDATRCGRRTFCAPPTISPRRRASPGCFAIAGCLRRHRTVGWRRARTRARIRARLSTLAQLTSRARALLGRPREGRCAPCSSFRIAGSRTTLTRRQLASDQQSVRSLRPICPAHSCSGSPSRSRQGHLCVRLHATIARCRHLDISLASTSEWLADFVQPARRCRTSARRPSGSRPRPRRSATRSTSSRARA